MELDVSGAKVFFTIHTDIPILGDLQISETMVVSWIVDACYHRFVYLADT